MSIAIFLALVGSPADAGNVYVNKVRVEPSELAGLEFKSVNVVTDEAGNVWIDAPGYNVSPVGVDGRPLPANGGPRIPAPTVPQPQIAPGPDSRMTETAAVPMPGPVGAVVSETVGAVTPGDWWLYAEDDGSSGHAVDVRINNVLVTTVRSGGQAPILELSRWLKPGTNRIECAALSVDATGGPLYVYVGRGQDENGTVQMGSPEIQFGVGQSRVGETRKSFQIEVMSR